MHKLNGALLHPRHRDRRVRHEFHERLRAQMLLLGAKFMDSEFFDARKWRLLPGAPQDVADEFNYLKEVTSYMYRPLTDEERERLNELLSDEKHNHIFCSLTV